MRMRAILFDIDGTLVDSNDQHVLAWQEIFRAHGYAFDRQVIHDQVGKGSDMLVPALLPDADQAMQERLGEAHGALFREKYLHQVRPFPAARDLLERVHRSGRKVVLASSASQRDLEHYLDLLDAGALVAATTSADDVESTKPAPDIFATALGKVPPTGPGEALVVGDTPYDVEAAGRCGIAAVALRSGGFSDRALRGTGALRVYDDVAALLAEFDNSPLNR
jgi:HAD superfamily hydrolase (TIGR01509 family)